MTWVDGKDDGAFHLFLTEVCLAKKARCSFFCFSLTSALEDTQQQQAPSTYIHMRSAFFLQRRSSRSWVLVFLIFSRLMR